MKLMAWTNLMGIFDNDDSQTMQLLVEYEDGREQLTHIMSLPQAYGFLKGTGVKGVGRQEK